MRQRNRRTDYVDRSRLRIRFDSELEVRTPTVDERFTKEDGYEVFSGNELIVKGALEAGIPIASGYMGSPVAESFTFAENYREWLNDRGFYWEAAKNEAEGVVRLNGARVAGKDAMAVMKSVGLNMAADPLGDLQLPSSGDCVGGGRSSWETTSMRPAHK